MAWARRVVFKALFGLWLAVATGIAREMPLGWPVILVCLDGVSVSGCSCLLSCSPSTRTYLLPSVSLYTLYRMICSSLLSAFMHLRLHESILPRSLVISHYVLVQASLGGVFSECPWGGQLQGEAPWESPWDCPLQREAPWRLHPMHCEIAWGVALQWPVALGSSLVSGVGKACCTQGAVWVAACGGHWHREGDALGMASHSGMPGGCSCVGLLVSAVLLIIYSHLSIAICLAIHPLSHDFLIVTIYE